MIHSKDARKLTISSIESRSDDITRPFDESKFMSYLKDKVTSAAEQGDFHCEISLSEVPVQDRINKLYYLRAIGYKVLLNLHDTQPVDMNTVEESVLDPEFCVFILWRPFYPIAYLVTTE